MKTIGSILDDYYARQGGQQRSSGPVDDIDLLISRVAEGVATPEEQQQVQRVLTERPELKDLLNLDRLPLEQFLSQPLPSARATQHIQHGIRVWPMLLRLAACFVAVVGGFIVYTHIREISPPPSPPSMGTPGIPAPPPPTAPVPVRGGGSTEPATPIRTRGIPPVPVTGDTNAAGVAVTNTPAAVTNTP